MADKTMDGHFDIHHPEHGVLAKHGHGNTFGPDDFIKLDSTWGGAKELCIEAWIRPTKDTGDFQAILSPADLSFIHFQTNEENKGNISIYTNTGVVLLPVIPEKPFKHWRHVAVSSKSGDSQLYIDGVPFGERNTKEFDYILSSDEVYVGVGYKKGRHFIGEIADLRVWNEARTHHQIHDDIYTHLEEKPEKFPLSKPVKAGFKSVHGKYMSAQPDGRMECNRDWLKGWEVFSVQEIEGSKDLVILKTKHGTYVTADGDDVSCNSKSVGAAQVWTRVTSGGKVGFKSDFGKYLSAQPDGRLECNRERLGSWELFEQVDPNKKPEPVKPIAKSISGFKSAHGKYMSAQPDGRMECNRDWLKGWEYFAVEPVEGKPGYASLKTVHNTYVSATAGGNVDCAAKSIGKDEVWKIDSKDGKVGFKSSKNKYLSAQPDGTLQCNRDILRGWELFTQENK